MISVYPDFMKPRAATPSAHALMAAVQHWASSCTDVAATRRATANCQTSKGKRVVKSDQTQRRTERSKCHGCLRSCMLSALFVFVNVND